MPELTLAHFAAISAALAEGFSVDDVLAIENVDAPAWEAAELAWTERLAADPVELARYRVQLEAAEDRFARRTSPIDLDAVAWVAFLAAFAAEPDPAAMLEAIGIGMNDLSRLQRAWARRQKIDKAVERMVVDAKKRGAGKLPPVVVGKSQLKASPHARAADAHAPRVAPVATTTEAAAPAMELDRYATLSAELALARGDDARVLGKYALTPAERDALDASFRARFAADPEVQRDFARLRAHHLARAAAAAVPGERAPSAQASRPARPDLDLLHRQVSPPGGPRREETVIARAPVLPALPFAKPGASASAASASISTLPKFPGAGSDGGTVVLKSPFADKTEPIALPPRFDDESTRILDADDPILESAVVPFVDAAPGSLSALAAASERRPAVASSSSLVVETVTGVRSPFAPATPFIESPATVDIPSPFAEIEDEPTTMMDPDEVVASPPSAGTSLLTRAPLASEPPQVLSDSDIVFAPDAPSTYDGELEEILEISNVAPERDAAQLLPFERHAWLCVEIALDGFADAALDRYGVTAEEKDRADAHWKGAFATDPALRAAWNRAFEAYRAWYAARG